MILLLVCFKMGCAILGFTHLEHSEFFIIYVHVHGNESNITFVTAQNNLAFVKQRWSALKWLRFQILKKNSWKMWLTQVLARTVFSLFLHQFAALAKTKLKEIFKSSIDVVKSNNEVNISQHLMKYYFTQDKGTAIFSWHFIRFFHLDVLFPQESSELDLCIDVFRTQ